MVYLNIVLKKEVEKMLHVLEHTLIDTIKLLPFLFIAYLIIELIEQKAGDKTTKLIKKSGKFGPILGSLLGIVPQCGFSAAASNLYAGRIITMGTLIAIFLSTSDEMLPILISEAVPAGTIIMILLIKVFIATIVGVIVDLIFRKKVEEAKEEIHKLCDEEHCHCEEHGVIRSSLKHTMQIFVYILIISLVLNIIIHFIGEENIAGLVLNVPVLGPVISSLVGLIPNCASSVILTQLYLENIISVGSMTAGLLVNSGIGVLILFRVNKSQKENFTILGILYLVSVISGIILDIFM